MPLPVDYEERVYAGVLGKIIGVYLGRPFEGWSYERITQELGEITYYVHEQLGKPLIVTDDDISGTFTFIRALDDYGNDPQITPAQIGQTWLNYIIERRSILWWGGMGNSTEHTAFLRLKAGIEAPRSGAIETNGQVVAEQIGAQIFIDGWAMVAPGDPERAVDLARRAASVSHDGEAIYGAQMLVAMESQAFVEQNLDVLFDTGLALIPGSSIIARMIHELRDLHAREPDWRAARSWLDEHYGYHIYGGGCHMIPNHGLMMLSLLYGQDDFQHTQMIVNTSGWDTDCNAGNVGCLMGIKNGLAGLDTGPDYRGPVADRLYIPTADGGRAISDAITETYHLVNSGRGLLGQPPLQPKNGVGPEQTRAHPESARWPESARAYHFDLPGAVQGFLPDPAVESRGTLRLENVAGHSASGRRSLAFHYDGIAAGRAARGGTATFLTEEAARMPGYALDCSPTLHPGQTIHARVEAAANNGGAVTVNLYLYTYGPDDARLLLRGPETLLLPGQEATLSWPLPPAEGDPSLWGPIAEVGLEIRSERRASGTIYLDTLTWEGTPDAVLSQPPFAGTMWQRAWVNSADHVWPINGLRISQDRGIGLVIQGSRGWTDYVAEASLTPHLAHRTGLAVRVQGLARYYALLLCADQTLCLVKALDGETLLTKVDFDWDYGETYKLSLHVAGDTLTGFVNGDRLLTATDEDRPLKGGAVALFCEVGRIDVSEVRVRPLAGNPSA